MKKSVTLLLAALMAISAFAAEQDKPLEIMALVDHFDFVGVSDPAHKGQFLYDSETSEGCAKILDHVLLTGSQTVLWRPESGSMMRYHSQEEGFLVRRGMDKRRMILHQEPVFTWVRYAETELDVVKYSLGLIRERGLCCGFHWPFEETHWASWTFGPYNLEHPQYWGMTRDGIPWSGRTSLAFPEAMAHKMRVVDELMEMRPQVIFIDTWRNGGWSPRVEYVKPQLERWKAKYGDTPPPPANDLTWCTHVSETIHEWYRLLRARMDQQNPRPRLLVGFQLVGRGGSRDEILRKCAIDWPKLVEEGLVDGIVVMGVSWDRKRPFESTREIYQDVMDIVGGRCQVFFPVQAYNFTNVGLISYAEATGLSQGKVTEELLKITREVGADGVVLEVVDHGNYHADVCAALRAEANRK